MGYCVDMQEVVFFIADKNKEAALKAVKALAKDETQMGGGTYYTSGKVERHYAWVNAQDFLDAKTLEDAMTEWRYCPETDDDGNIVGLMFEGEKLGDETALFKALAPFIKSGSYIQMHGEDGSTWRWCFDGGKFEEKSGRIVWE